MTIRGATGLAMPIGRVAAAVMLLLLAVASTASPTHAGGRGQLYAFKSEAELVRFLQRSQGVRPGFLPEPVPVPPPPPPPPPVMAMPSVSPAAPAAPAAKATQDVPVEVSAFSAESIVVTGSRIASPSITNTQEAAVDEGGIVKVQGEVLVILRRGRLFTVSVAGGGMKAVDQINAFPPGSDGDGWYDEMLVADGWVVVIGYSYGGGGTELNRFRISPEGRLTYADTYYLRSDDYYSSDNYASRLIGRNLIFYTPLPLYWETNPLDVMPAIKKREGGKTGARFRRIAQAQNIYIAPDMRRDPESVDTLHSVTTCNLTAPTLKCSAMGVLGPESRSFYVSSSAVYLWVGDEWSERGESRPESQIYRLPFDDEERPGAVGVRGGPINQFSFREDRRDGVLNVLVKSEGGGDGMWRSDFGAGALALVRMPLAAFGDGMHEVDKGRYRVLPSPGPFNSLTNRYVGQYLLYGVGNDWVSRDVDNGPVWAVPLSGGDITGLKVGQAVERIEITGRDAIVVGGDRMQNLVFSSIELTTGAPPKLGDRYVNAASSEGETRSHAFFYSPDASSPYGDSGLLGLPIARPGRPAFRQLFQNSAAMLFLRRKERRLSPLGELAASAEGFQDDSCVASCSDWYGNARPIFLYGRVFALLGYELVEGKVGDGDIREIGRVNFAPKRPAAGREAP